MKMFAWVLLTAALAGSVRAGVISSGTKTDDFPNDFGPASIDVSSYPQQHQESYKAMLVKCAVCHSPARPINSQYLELTADEIAKAKIEDPEIFKDKKLTQVEEGLWKRYVKRMMAKPGCPVRKDGKRIYEFLVFDSKLRKTGKAGAAWRAHRQKLLNEFKKKKPEAYDKLFAK